MARPEQSRRTPPLVLASGSPRRRELLERAGLSFEVLKPEVDESVRPSEAPEAYVQRLSQEKAAAAAQQRTGAFIVAADTSVVLGPRLLGKPASPAEAAEMLQALAGREHAVLTGVTVRGAAPGEGRSFVNRTQVVFEPLTPAQIAWYVATPEPYDKAGGYAIQGIAGSFIRSISGSYANVVGLPVAEVLAALAELRFPLPWSPA
jgi:septum formation protein